MPGFRLVVGRGVMAVAAGVVLAACASSPSPSNTVAVAYATVIDSAGTERGFVALRQDRDNIVHVDVAVTGLPPGPHAIHFHSVGKCEGRGSSAFATANSHFNPLGRQHGLDNAAGPHAGDAPNITVNAAGTVTTTFTTDRVSLTDGSTSLFDGDGSSIVIHAGPDDQMSQPAGNAGGRIACGVLVRGVSR